MVMNAYVDCGMQLVFHGVVAYICEVMESFVSDHGLSLSFLSIANEHLSEIEELKLEWCKMKCLPKKLWLGENELGFSRVMPFVFGVFFLNVKWPKNSDTTPESIEATKQMIHALLILISILVSQRDPE